MKKLSDCRVLLVDDAKANLDILVEGLKSDHKLSLALNGEMALQIAARTPPDLVLLDIMMPGMDGYEVCRRLRQMPETAEVPIMFLSSEEVQNKTRGFEAGHRLPHRRSMLEVKARVRSLLKAKAYSDAVKEQIASELRVAGKPNGHAAARLRPSSGVPGRVRRRARTGARGGRRSLRRARRRNGWSCSATFREGHPRFNVMVRAISSAGCCPGRLPSPNASSRG
jgi:CheY-like chemotaxis protein